MKSNEFRQSEIFIYLKRNAWKIKKFLKCDIFYLIQRKSPILSKKCKMYDKFREISRNFQKNIFTRVVNLLRSLKLTDGEYQNPCYHFFWILKFFLDCQGKMLWHFGLGNLEKSGNFEFEIQWTFCNNFSTLLLCRINVLDIFDMRNFSQYFTHTTKIFEKSNILKMVRTFILRNNNIENLFKNL